ncbi:MAG TPA: hypothetical protein VJA21_03375 [Verrucomicrobiae bacterium]
MCWNTSPGGGRLFLWPDNTHEAPMRTIPAALVIAGFGLLNIPALGQFYSPLTIEPSLLKFLPEGAAFTATLEVEARNQTPTLHWPVYGAIRGGMSRVEMDVSKMGDGKADHSWQGYVELMQQAGSAECVTIFNPDRKCLFTVLPRLKAYMEQPIPEAALEELKRKPNAQRVELGTEEVAGRIATKTKITFNKHNMDVWRTWETPEAIVWTAKNSPLVPLRIVVFDSLGETNAILIFKNLQNKKPPSALFAPPDGFAKLDQESLMKRITEKFPKAK